MRRILRYVDVVIFFFSRDGKRVLDVVGITVLRDLYHMGGVIRYIFGSDGSVVVAKAPSDKKARKRIYSTYSCRDTLEQGKKRESKKGGK